MIRSGPACTHHKVTHPAAVVVVIVVVVVVVAATTTVRCREFPFKDEQPVFHQLHPHTP